MRLIRQPNNWTCNPCSFAMCMDVTLEKMIEVLGHDGSRIIDYNATCVTEAVECFDAYELVLAAYKLGYAAIEFPLKLGSISDDLDVNPYWPHGSKLFDYFPEGQRFVMVLQSSKYPGRHHCVAWEKGKDYYLDPQHGKIETPFRQPVVYAIAITRICDVKE